MSNQVTQTRGIGFVGLLTIAFIVLKLTGVIAWQWGWVLSPLWISFTLWLVIFVLPFLILWLHLVIRDARRERLYRRNRK